MYIVTNRNHRMFNHKVLGSKATGYFKFSGMECIKYPDLTPSDVTHISQVLDSDLDTCIKLLYELKAQPNYPSDTNNVNIARVNRIRQTINEILIKY